ncbi:MAG: glycosyltransferase family 4 protein [Candidatus Nanopusillus acidilobi]
MKIALFGISHLSVNRGYERWLIKVASYLSKKYDVRVITTNSNKKYDLNNLNFEYIVINYRKKYGLLHNISEIKNYLKDIDITYAFYVWFGTQIDILKYSKKVIFGHHEPLDRPIQRVYYSILENIIARKIKYSYHHFLTKYRANIYKKKGFKKIFVIPNFVELDKYKPKEKSYDKFKIICPGVINILKGIDILIKVAENLKKYNDIEFYITGNKPIYENLPSNVKYLGMLSEEQYIDVISTANLMFLPTRIETFSFSVLENLAVGNLIVVSNLPDVISAFGESESIYYAKLNNVEDYINGILKYYQIWKNNKDKYEELSKKAREIASRFDSNIILPKIEEMFKKVYESS